MDITIFTELSIIFSITVVLTALTRVLKQPSIIAYILSGIVAGPYFLNVINSQDTFSAFSQIGIALLLFLVGLGLNPKVVKEVGSISAITGIGQVVFTTTIGFILIKLFGFNTIEALYMGVALAFSSTIVIMKLLSDKKELDSLHGKISVGFLIIQDFVAIFILLVISSFSSTGSIGQVLLETFLKGILAFTAITLISLYILPTATNFIAKSQEFLLMFSIAWCFLIAAIFNYLNFSIEAGALIAGVSLSVSPYNTEISSKLKPLRDFFLVLFFILLGSHMVFTNLVVSLPTIVVLSLFVLVGNPLIVILLMSPFGYTKRVSFLSGLTVAQISEFSLIIISMGLSAGHLSQNTLSVVTAVGLITFIGSAYMILYSEQLYKYLIPYLKYLEKDNVHKNKKEVTQVGLNKYDVILFGYNRIGFDILKSLSSLSKKYLVVDFNPQTIKLLKSLNVNCLYGDAKDIELLGELDFTGTKMVISTIPNLSTNCLILKHVQQENPKTMTSLVAHTIEDAVDLYKLNATYVIMPHFLGGKQFANLIKRNNFSKRKFMKEKASHLRSLKQRKVVGHQHPQYV
jgi:Kef-type K+ transport system membrane component KefB/Trk K+ transport system NAD-binding subunit